MSKAIKRIITTSIIIVAIILLTIFMVMRTSEKTRENALSHMKSIAQEQSVMLENYIDNAKQTLSGFGTADEVSALLEELQEKDLLKENRSYSKEEVLKVLSELDTLEAAQGYTSRFSDTVENPEGIWIGDWYTHVLTHTNNDPDPEKKSPIGNTTRDRIDKAEALKQLQDGMINAEDNLYVYGIMISPALAANDKIPPVDKQVVSMYKAVMKDGKPIGFVGFGVFTKELARSFDKLELNSADTTYSMVNLVDNSYIFCDDDDLVSKPVEDERMLEICNKYKGTKANITGSYESGGTVTFYSYMAENGWALFINTPSSEVFAFSRSINLNMIIFCAICVALIVIFNIISIRQDQTMERLEQSRKKQAAISKNLHIAALKDILTDVNNRNKFIDDFSINDDGSFKVEDCPDTPYCFAMFNISGFSRINISYGHDVGDLVLVSTADILKERFGAENVYRTGSDEFVVAVKSPVSTVSAFLKDIHLTLAELKSPRRVGDDLMNIPYAASALKKSSSISSTVLVTLKDLININGVSPEGNVVFVDLDNVQL